MGIGKHEDGLITLLQESRQQLEELDYAEERLARLEKDTAAALRTADRRRRSSPGPGDPPGRSWNGRWNRNSGN